VVPREKQVLLVMKLLSAREDSVSLVRKRVSEGQSIIAKGVEFDIFVLKEALSRWDPQAGSPAAASGVQQSSCADSHTRSSTQHACHLHVAPSPEVSPQAWSRGGEVSQAGSPAAACHLHATPSLEASAQAWSRGGEVSPLPEVSPQAWSRGGDAQDSQAGRPAEAWQEISGEVATGIESINEMDVVYETVADLCQNHSFARAGRKRQCLRNGWVDVALIIIALQEQVESDNVLCSIASWVALGIFEVSVSDSQDAAKVRFIVTPIR